MHYHIFFLACTVTFFAMHTVWSSSNWTNIFIKGWFLFMLIATIGMWVLHSGYVVKGVSP